MTAKAKVDLDIRGDRYKEFIAVLKELIGYEGTLKLHEKEEQAGTEICILFPGADFRTGACRRFSFSGCDTDPAGLHSDLLPSARSPEKKRSGRKRGVKIFLHFFHGESFCEDTINPEIVILS